MMIQVLRPEARSLLVVPEGQGNDEGDRAGVRQTQVLPCENMSTATGRLSCLAGLGHAGAAADTGHTDEGGEHGGASGDAARDQRASPTVTRLLDQPGDEQAEPGDAEESADETP
jgi:hypothetical protein